MESFIDEPSIDEAFPMASFEPSSPSGAYRLQSISEMGVGENENSEIPASDFASPFESQDAYDPAFGDPVGFPHPNLHPAEATSQPPATSASELPFSFDDPPQLQWEEPILGATNPLSPSTSPNQNMFPFQQPRTSSHIPSTTADMFNAPAITPPSMLPPAPRGMPAPTPAQAPATTRGRGRSLGVDADWTRHKNIIWKLYMDESKTLQKTREIMKKDYGFCPEINKFKHQLKLWGFEKNLKAKQSRYIKRVAKKRKLEGKKTEFRHMGAVIPSTKMDRLLKAKREAASSETCTSPSNMSFGTPRSKPLSLAIRSPSLREPEQFPANASSMLPVKVWHEYDLEGLNDLHERAINEGEEGNDEQARIMFLETLGGYEALVGPCHYLSIQALSSFVQYCEFRDLFDEARNRMQISLSNHQTELGGKHQKTLESMARLGHFYMRRKQYGNSAVSLKTAKDGLENIFSSDPAACFRATQHINDDLIDIYLEQRDYDRCEGEFLSIICKLEALHGTQRHYDDLISTYKDRLSHVYSEMPRFSGQDEVGFEVFPFRPPPLIKAEKLRLDIIKEEERKSDITLHGLCAYEKLREQYHAFDEKEKLNVLLTRIENKISAAVGASTPLTPQTTQEKLIHLERGIAKSHKKLGNKKAAEWWLLRGQAQIERDEGLDSVMAIMNLIQTARFHLRQNEWEDAEPLFRDAKRKIENGHDFDAEDSEELNDVKQRIAICLNTRVWMSGCPKCGI